jgi:hypothetical protein
MEEGYREYRQTSAIVNLCFLVGVISGTETTRSSIATAPAEETTPDRRVATCIDQPSDFISLQNFTPLTDWSSFFLVVSGIRTLDLAYIMHCPHLVPRIKSRLK